jgi:hypothetical protein
MRPLPASSKAKEMAEPLQPPAARRADAALAPATVSKPEAIQSLVSAGPPDTSRQLEFLYKSLDDNQNVVRFLDAKAGFAIVLLSAMVGKILSSLGNYLPVNGMPLWYLLLLCAFSTTLLVAVFIFVRIIFPTSNPAANCRIHAPAPPFFLYELKPRRFRRIFTSNPKYSQLVQDHDAYVEQIRTADGLALVRVVSAEVLKVCYIRQIKTDRLRGLAHASGTCAVMFAALMVADAVAPKVSKPQPVQIQGPVLLHPVPAPAPRVQPASLPAPTPLRRGVTGKSAKRP